MLEKAPKSKTIKRLREEFQRKGFLSKREIRELSNLMADTQAA